MKVVIEVEETKRNIILLSIESGKFSEGKLHGDFYYGGGTALVNMDDGRQFKIRMSNVIESLIHTAYAKKTKPRKRR